MPTQFTTTFTDRARSATTDGARVYRSLTRQPSWVLRILFTFIALLVFLGILLLVIPLAIILVLVTLLAVAYNKLKAAISPLIPHRDRDGRKNVRVRR